MEGGAGTPRLSGDRLASAHTEAMCTVGSLRHARDHLNHTRRRAMDIRGDKKNCQEKGEEGSQAQVISLFYYFIFFLTN